MLFRQVPNMIECMLYMVQPSETQSWSSDMSQEENSTSWKWGHVFFTGCLIFDNTQKLFDFCLRVYAWPGDQLYSVFTDCIVIYYKPQVTPTKNIGKAFERTPFIVGKTLQSDSCMSKSKAQIHACQIQSFAYLAVFRCVFERKIWGIPEKSIQNKGQMCQH